jgi:hypothetical protein
MVIFRSKHPNFGFFVLVPKSPIHTGLIYVKKTGAEYLMLGKCVLDLNFAPIKGSVFLISKKRSNLLYRFKIPHLKR